MADQVMDAASEYAALVPELWSSFFYDTLLENLVFADSVDQSWQGEIQGLGDTVNISQFPQFDVAEDIAEDQRVDADGVTVSNLQLVINHQLAKDYIVTEKAMKQALAGDNKLRDLAMFAIMKKMQSIIISDTVPSSSSPDHQIAYDQMGRLAA